MRKVVIEHPVGGKTALYLEYAKQCLKDSLDRGEAPFSSGLLYCQVLDDLFELDRRQGMEAGFSWGQEAELCAVYSDLGTSKGMKQGIELALARGIPVEIRRIL